jgi:hypothetical protein
MGMSGDLYVRHKIENNYNRGRYENTKKISDKHSDEDGETLERFYSRIKLDEKRRKILDDSKKDSVLCWFSDSVIAS